MTQKTVIEFILDEMKKQDLSQRDLAVLVGCNEATLSRWLNGLSRMPVNMFTKCVEALGYEIFLRKRGESDGC